MNRAQQEYEKRLMTPDQAVSDLQSGSKIGFGIGIGQPPALLAAIAARLRSGDLSDLSIHYKLAMKHAAETVLADDVLHAVNPCPLFLTDVDRKIIKKQQELGEKILSYVPAYFYQMPRLFTDFIHLDTFINKGKSTKERALSLIGIAHPNFRDELIKEAEKVTLI